jgi:Zn-dependent protease with chaperone function
MRQAVAFVLVSAIIVGCAAPSRRFRARHASEVETRVLTEAIRPLLQELDYPPPRRADDCRVGLLIVVSPAINAGARPGQASPCLFFTLAVTEGAMQRLSVAMLRAMLAHELGHVHLGHFDAKKARAGTPIIFRPVSRAFGGAQEEEADRFAVQLLRKIDARHPGACVALVYVFSILAEQPAAPGAWLSTHPSPARRADTALAGCQRKESSNF